MGSFFLNWFDQKSFPDSVYIPSEVFKENCLNR